MGAKDFLNSLLLKELFKGLAVTGRYMFAPKITVQYPEEKTPQSNRFRGLHALRRQRDPRPRRRNRRRTQTRARRAAHPGWVVPCGELR